MTTKRKKVDEHRAAAEQRAREGRAAALANARASRSSPGLINVGGVVAVPPPPEWHGPMRRCEWPAGDWTVVGEQLREGMAGWPGRWDVYALHRSGVRVPPGQNLHAEPWVEMAWIAERV